MFMWSTLLTVVWKVGHQIQICEVRFFGDLAGGPASFSEVVSRSRSRSGGGSSGYGGGEGSSSRSKKQVAVLVVAVLVVVVVLLLPAVFAL